MASLTGALVWTAAVGLTLGAIGGAMLTLALRRFWVPDHLQGTAALATALLLFALSDTLAHESGLITVTVMGIWLANQKNFSIEHIIELKENLRTLLIGCLFVVLGSRVNLADVAAIGLPGIGFVLALILIVRPASVFLSLLGSPLGFREQAFVAGLAPRGIVAAAVSSVFALDLESRTAGAIEGADQLATATFLVIIATVAVYGIAAEPLARLLRLADESDNGLLIAGASPWVRAFACEVHQAGIPVVLVDSNFNKISKARVDGLNAVCANILNEHVREDLDLVGIGRFLAMTPNDEVNSLAQRECRSLFGSSAVFQLTFNSKNSGGERGLTQDIMGRELFSDNCTFSSMEHAFEAGAKFKTTNLTATYTYEDFRDRNGPGTVVLCTIKEDGSLRLNSVDDPIAPAPGHTVIAMVTSEGSR
ncbi:MAG: cation:proton antiporter [Planctomycetota bacterium]